MGVYSRSLMSTIKLLSCSQPVVGQTYCMKAMAPSRTSSPISEQHCALTQNGWEQPGHSWQGAHVQTRRSHRAAQGGVRARALWTLRRTAARLAIVTAHASHPSANSASLGNSSAAAKVSSVALRRPQSPSARPISSSAAGSTHWHAGPPASQSAVKLHPALQSQLGLCSWQAGLP